MEQSFLDDLLEYVNEEEEQALGIQHDEAFVIDSVEQANYFARKLNELRAEKQQIAATAQDQIDVYVQRVDAWKNKTLAPLEYEEDRLLAMLKFFAETQLSGSTKKSIKLVEGTLQFRKQQAAYEYNDELLLDYMQRAAAQYVVIKPSVDKKEFKKAITVKDGQAILDGNIVPGVTITERPEAFDLK